MLRELHLYPQWYGAVSLRRLWRSMLQSLRSPLR